MWLFECQLCKQTLVNLVEINSPSFAEGVALATSEVFGPVGDYLGMRDLYDPC